MKKHFILILLGILVLPLLNAQKKENDVVYLKDGSVIKGNIIEINSSSSLKIETLCENILVFALSQVDSVKKEKVSTRIMPGGIHRTGYMNITSFGILAGPSSAAYPAPFSLHTVNGYKFNGKYMAGAGIGLEIIGDTYIPVFADLRYKLKDRGLSPFVALKAGYTMPLGGAGDYYTNYYYEYDAKGGPMASAGIGFSLRMNAGNSMIVQFAYRYQELKNVERSYNDHEIIHHEFMKRFAVHFGFNFD